MASRLAAIGSFAGLKYVLHAYNPWGRAVWAVADAEFGGILSVLPVYSWRTNNARFGGVARIIHVPEDIYGDRKAAPSPQQRGDIAPSTPPRPD